MPTETNQQNNDSGNSNQTNQTNQETNVNATLTFEQWLEKADEPTKTLINDRFSALESTVKATRGERDAATSQLRDALKKAEKGSELEKTLTETIGRLEAVEKKATFLEEAVKPNIGCRNPKAAFALATAENLFTRNGSPAWDEIKAAAPELFGTIMPRSNAGNGTGEEPPKNQNMNAIIRKMAGVE